MAHVGIHAVTAGGFFVAGNVAGAVGCLLPDLVWFSNEVKIQKAKPQPALKTIETFSDQEVFPYRAAHSLLLWWLILVPYGFLIDSAWSLLIGVSIHIALDLPTHKGKLTPMPLFPFQWRWRWTFKR